MRVIQLWLYWGSLPFVGVPARPSFTYIFCWIFARIESSLSKLLRNRFLILRILKSATRDARRTLLIVILNKLIQTAIDIPQTVVNSLIWGIKRWFRAAIVCTVVHNFMAVNINSFLHMPRKYLLSHFTVVWFLTRVAHPVDSVKVLLDWIVYLGGMSGRSRRGSTSIFC